MRAINLCNATLHLWCFTARRTCSAHA